MNERQSGDNNPLEEAAAEMSEGLYGTTVEVEQTSKSKVEGGQVHMVDSAAKSVSASALHMEDSAAAVVRSSTVDVTDGAIGLAVASEVTLNESSSLGIVAKTVRANDMRTLFVAAPQVKGNLETVFTPLTALAAGAGLALGFVFFGSAFAWLVSRPLRRLRRRDAS